MKKILVFVLVAFITLTAAVVADIYSSLEISKDQAKQSLLQSIAEGHIVSNNQYEMVKKARSLPVEMRVAGVRQLIALAKEYTASDEFKRDYQQYRKERVRPGGGQKKRFGLPKLRNLINNAVDNAVDKAVNSKDNEERYPEDPQKLVKKRLEEFLDLSASVDFSAQRLGGGFADAEFEGKSDQWKMCYRAGKEVVAAAREEAQKWVAEIK